MATPLEWLAMAGWPSIDDLAGFSGVHRSTVSRRVPEWLESGMVGVRDDGRLLRPRVRLLLGTGGLDDVFPQHHTHPGPRRIYHIHDPLDPGSEDHTHPQFFNGYAGAALLYSRLEMIEIAVQPLAPYALMGEGASWTHDGRARQLHLMEVAEAHPPHQRRRHIRRRVQAVLLLDRTVGYGPHARVAVQAPLRPPPALGHQMPVADGLESWTDWLIDPPDRDLDLDPQPSGWVIVTPDYRGAELAADVLPVHGCCEAQRLFVRGGARGRPACLHRASAARAS